MPAKERVRPTTSTARACGLRPEGEGQAGEGVEDGDRKDDDGDEVVRAVLRTRENVHPVFISQGHKVSLPTCVEIVLKCLDGYRVPKPTREAHHFVATLKQAGKGEQAPPSLFGEFE